VKIGDQIARKGESGIVLPRLPLQDSESIPATGGPPRSCDSLHLRNTQLYRHRNRLQPEPLAHAPGCSQARHEDGSVARGQAMNPWLIAGAAVSAALVPCADMCLRGKPERRLVGFQMTSTLVTLAMALFTIGFGRIPFIDLPLALAIVAFGGGLVYARFLGKHL
jgi:multisubunit Na+/H+ antiporter MnhF subunit